MIDFLHFLREWALMALLQVLKMGDFLVCILSAPYACLDPRTAVKRLLRYVYHSTVDQNISVFAHPKSTNKTI